MDISNILHVTNSKEVMVNNSYEAVRSTQWITDTRVSKKNTYKVSIEAAVLPGLKIKKKKRKNHVQKINIM